MEWKIVLFIYNRQVVIFNDLAVNMSKGKLEHLFTKGIAIVEYNEKYTQNTFYFKAGYFKRTETNQD